MSYQYQIEGIKSPRYMNNEGTVIDCNMKLSLFPFYIPYCAASCDVEPRGRYAYDLIVSGEFGEIAPYEAEASPTDPAAVRDLFRRVARK